MAGLPVSPLKGISLLFLKTDDIVSSAGNNTQFPNGLDIIYAIEEVSGKGSIEGAQRIGKLYRIYIKNNEAKDKLTTEGFSFGGRHVNFYSQNPFTVKDHPDTVKIIIGGVPLSVANSEFEKALIDLNVQMVSDIKFENYRDKEGKWTSYKTGRRFVYCQKPQLNLKPSVRIGLWNGSLYYREQVRPRWNATHAPKSDINNPTVDNIGIDTAEGEVELTSTGKNAEFATNSIDTREKMGNPSPDITSSKGIDTRVTNTVASSKISTGNKQKNVTKGNLNKLTNFVARSRPRSQSLNNSKRKQMVSDKISAPSPKSLKSQSQNHFEILKTTKFDWFDNNSDTEYNSDQS